MRQTHHGRPYSCCKVGGLVGQSFQRNTTPTTMLRVNPQRTGDLALFLFFLAIFAAVIHG